VEAAVARILVTDDDPDSRLMLATMLELAGHEVLVAADGREALRRFAEARPDLLVVDIFMPGMDGVQVIRELRRHHPGARIVAVSAGWRVSPNLQVTFADYDVLDEARAHGADATLPKPIIAEHLLAAVDRLLAR
jgi:CheY-like chemotaxis protein